MNISIAGIAVENGRVFIARRIQGGDMGGKWEFPGGKMEEGESCEISLEREFFEEFGIIVHAGERLGESSFEHKGIDRALYAYRVYFADDNFHNHFRLVDHSEWKWATLTEIRELDFTPSDLSLLPFIEPVIYG